MASVETDNDPSVIAPLAHTVPAARRRLGLPNDRFLYRLVADGRLSTVKLGRRTFVLEAECQRFIESLAGAPGRGAA